MINFKTPINFLGYGRVGFGIFKSLVHDHHQKVCYWPIGQPDCEPIYHPMLQQGVTNQESFSPLDPTLTIWHQNDLFQRIGRGRNTAITFFELNKLNNRDINSLDCQDIIIQASQWGADIVKQHLPDKDVRVVRMGVDSNYFRPFNLKADKPYRFLYVSKIEIRKGHDILHELFNNAFTKDDNVELYISWSNPFIDQAEHQRWTNLYKNTPLGDKIFFIDRKIDIRGEYAAADCYIAPTRAESLGLGVLEAMSMNKPVITTYYSGLTEFCNATNSYLVEIDELESANDGQWFFGDGEWAKIGEKQEQQFIEHMRHCYKNRINTNPGGRETAEELDWKNVSQSLLEVLNAS